jgi:DNA topoisomerase-1
LLEGRYGPYVTDGSLNASLPRGKPPDQLSMADALDLLRARAERMPVKRAARGRAKSPGAKKPKASAAEKRDAAGASAKAPGEPRSAKRRPPARPSRAAKPAASRKKPAARKKSAARPKPAAAGAGRKAAKKAAGRKVSLKSK